MKPIDWTELQKWTDSRLCEIVAGTGHGQLTITIYVRNRRIDLVSKQASETEKMAHDG